jgi:hypothetical protein
MHLTGYASTFDATPEFGGPGEGGWMEQVSREAWEEAVAKKPRVPLRLGMDGPVIGEADLSVDDDGVRVDATVNVGYTFRALDQQWSGVDTARRITSLSIGEMSIAAMPQEPEPRG